MSADVERIAFFSPKEVDRDVLTIRFDDNNKVIEVTRLNKEDGKELKVCDEKTENFSDSSRVFLNVSSAESVIIRLFLA